MDVTSATAAATSTQAQNRKALSTNFDTFLKLLTQQLRYRDPTNPMDTNEFTQQLVQYSQVEQQISTNENLQSLLALSRASAGSTALNYLGRSVVTKGDAATLTGGQAQWGYELPAAAQSAQLVISDANGRIVFSGAGNRERGDHTLNWDGRNQQGNALPDGTYRLEVRALASDGSRLTVPVTSTGKVTEADLSQGDPSLMIGSRKVTLSDIVSIKATQ